MFPIQDVSEVDIAFPANVTHLMPAYEVVANAEVPDKYKELVDDWFAVGLKSLTFKPRAGVDERKALRQLTCIMKSFEPKHQHKTAAVAYLIHDWFEDAQYEVRDKEKRK